LTAEPGKKWRNANPSTLVFNADQVRKLARRGTVYQASPPCQFIENKLKELFSSSALFIPFRLFRRNINVELEHTSEEGYFTEAKSLTLAAIVAILCALTGRKLEPPAVFSARVRQDGALPKVGHIPDKLKAVKDAGIRKVILSTENRRDVPLEYLNDKNLTVYFFSHIGEVLHHLGLFPDTSSDEDRSPPLWEPAPRSEGWKFLMGLREKKASRKK